MVFNLRRISFSNERARAANHHLFEQVEEGDAALLLVGGAAGGLKIFVQVADPGGGEVTAVPAGEEGDLVVQVKDGVVDRGGRKQDQLLALAAHPAAPVIGGQDALEVLVAPGVAIAEVVAFVHQQDIGVLHISTIEFVATQAFLGDDACGDSGAEQFVVPHLLQGGGADDQRLVALVISEVFQQFLADPGFAEAHAVGDHHAVVSRQDFARLLDGVLLEFAQFDHRAGTGPSILTIEVVAEVLEDGLHVDLVGAVGFAPELGGVEQIDQVLLEVAGSFPLPFVPRREIANRQHARHIGGGHALEVAQFRQALALVLLKETPHLFGTDFFRGKVRAVHQVELPAGEQAGPREVGGANNGRDGIEALEATSAVEEVALGVQEPMGVETHLHLFPAQESNQVFNQAQRLLIKVFPGQVANEPLNRFRASFAQAQVSPGLWFVTQQQAEVAQTIQPITQQLPSANVEVGGGDIQRMTSVTG